MTHPRISIRAAVKAMLDAAKPMGWTVAPGRGRPVAIDRCPRVVIGTPSETVARGSQRKVREIVLTIAAYVAAADDGEIAADAAAEWIEATLDADPTLGGTVQDSIHTGSEIEPTTGGEQPVWQVTLAYSLRIS